MSPIEEPADRLEAWEVLCAVAVICCFATPIGLWMYFTYFA